MMSASSDLYQTLGVPRSATPDQIRTAYRKLARKYHPDMNPGNKQAEELFKRVSAAHDVLSDPKRRKLYDEFGDAALNEGFDPGKARVHRQYRERMRTRPGAGPSFEDEPPGGPDFESVFGDFMGGLFGKSGRRRGKAAGPEKGQDVITTVELDLAQALRGVEIQVQIPGSPQRAPTTVRIPPGAEDGSRLRVGGHGMPGADGGPAGDLVIETRVRPHPFFRREGLDLILKLPVTLHEAYCGASVEIPTPDGAVKLKIPPRSQQGSRLRVRGKGASRGGKTGDLLVELDVRMPDRDDPRLAAALEPSDTAYSRPVRVDVKL